MFNKQTKFNNSPVYSAPDCTAAESAAMSVFCGSYGNPGYAGPDDIPVVGSEEDVY